MHTHISASLLSEIILASGQVGYSWDLQTGKIIWFGPYEKLFGTNTPPPDANDFANYVLTEPDAPHPLSAPITLNRMYHIKQKDGNLLRVSEHATTDFDGDKPVKQQGLIRIITECDSFNCSSAAHTKAQITPKKYTLPENDSFTGLPNRNAIITEIEHILNSFSETRTPPAKVYLTISIDKMSFINDALGTQGANDVIFLTAKRIAEIIPTNSLLARVGGDTFGLITETEDNGTALAETILQNFRNHPLETRSGPLHITLSIGGIKISGAITHANEIMIRSEQALHDAQQSGRNRYITFQDHDSRVLNNKNLLEMAEKVRTALKNNGVKLAFQPVVETETGRVLFYEVLSRLFDNDGKPIPAGDFIPAVEIHGLAPEFDRHVLKLSIKELEEHPHLELAVNVSGHTASLPGWPDYIREELHHKEDLAKRLIIEITETAAVSDVSETEKFSRFLQDIGGRVAIDDFGAGSTSIRHLRTFSLAIMKIDHALIIDLLGNPEQEHLVRMLISIAHGFGLKVVGEGVENEEIAEWLRKEKVDMLQGYFFGRPLLEKPWANTQAHTLITKTTAEQSSDLPLSVSKITVTKKF